MAAIDPNDYYCHISAGSTSVNISPYIEEYQWTFNDVDAPKSGRTLDGVMHRGKVDDKFKLQIKLLPLTHSEVQGIVARLRNQYVYVRTNLIPDLDENTSFSAYNSARGGKTTVIGTDGVIRHSDISFNIVQR